MNNVVLIGRLTRDVDCRFSQSGMAIASMTVAIDRGKDKDGNDKGADFPRVKVFGKTAENCDRFLSKGRQVAVHGRLETGSYEDKNGNKVYTTDVIADRVEFLGSSENSSGRNDRRSGQQKMNPADYDDIPDSFQATDDDMPF